MNKLLTTIVGGVAFAGLDWKGTEQARKNRRAQVARMQKRTPEEKCATKRLGLPLRHGPRAQSTPYLNEKRSQSFEAALKACKSSGQGDRAMSLQRRHLSAAMVIALVGSPLLARAAPPLVEVWTSPACGCCKAWVKHLEANGFEVKTHNTGNTDARTRLGLPVKYGACHTARVAGYVLEGHVPAREVLRLLKEKPDAVGLAVPAMPRGSPGMDGPAYHGKRDPFDVLLVLRDGSASPYQSYR